MLKKQILSGFINKLKYSLQMIRYLIMLEVLINVEDVYYIVGVLPGQVLHF